MRPRFPQGAQRELQEVSDLLGRQLPPPQPTKSTGGNSFWKWLFIAAMFALASNWLSRPSPPPAPSPVADVSRVTVVPTPTPAPAIVEPPAPRAELVRIVPRAELVRMPLDMPDGRHIMATLKGRLADVGSLPWSGNRIGDTWIVGNHSFVWLAPIGQTNPTWIDP